ncbi:MAG: hypothetical protein ACREJV_03530, partial [Candidatus Rokuibacteriota bacterium]
MTFIESRAYYDQRRARCQPRQGCVSGSPVLTGAAAQCYVFAGGEPMAIWDDVIPEAERQLYAKGGMGEGRVGMGERPAIIVVDMTYGFVDSAFPLGHSATGYPVVAAIRRLLEHARPLGIPIFYSRSKSGASTC